MFYIFIYTNKFLIIDLVIMTINKSMRLILIDLLTVICNVVKNYM